MIISEEKLIGWLCFSRMNRCSEGTKIGVPTEVFNKFLELEWIEDEGEMTEKGIMVSDLGAPEWGIDPIIMEEYE